MLEEEMHKTIADGKAERGDFICNIVLQQDGTYESSYHNTRAYKKEVSELVERMRQAGSAHWEGMIHNSNYGY